MHQNNHPPLAILLLIGLVAGGLRLYGLDVQSLWHDELFSWYSSQLESLSLAVDFGASQDVHPPGFVAFLYFWRSVFGDSEAALRLPSAIAGIASCWWIYLLGKRWFNTRIGLTSATLLSVSSVAIYFSQEARAYSFVLLGTVALAERTLEITQRATSEPVSKGQISLLAFLCIALSYLHYFGLLFVALTLASWGLTLLRKRVGWRPWIIVTGLSVAAYLPWANRVFNQIGRGKVWIPEVTLSRVIEVYASLAQQQLIAVICLWFAGALCGWAWAKGNQKQTTAEWFQTVGRSSVLWILAWASIPMFATVAISKAVLPVLTDRNLIIILPAMILLTSLSLESIERWLKGRPVMTTIIVVLGLGELLGTRYYEQPTKWQYRAVVDSVMDQASDHNSIAMVSGAWHPSYFNYYFKLRDSEIRVTASGKGMKQLRRQAQATGAPTVFVAAPAGKRPRKRGQLQVNGYTRTNVEKFIGWDLYRFAKKEPLD
jgi:mannosyltransferase